MRTRHEAIEIALREMILRRRLQDMMQLEGSGLLELEQLKGWRATGVEV